MIFFFFFFFGKNYYFKTGLVLPTIFPCCHMVLMHVLTKALKSILSVQKRGRQQVLSGRYSSVTLQSDCGDGACWHLTPLHGWSEESFDGHRTGNVVVALQAKQVWSISPRLDVHSYLPVLSVWLHCTSSLSWHCGPWGSMAETWRGRPGVIFLGV